MARKRKAKKTKRKKKSGGFGSALKSTGALILKVIPLVLVITAAGAAFMGVKSALYADSNLAVQQVIVEPAHVLSLATKQRLDNKLIGENILKTDLYQVATELEKDPHIQRAFVTRGFPADIRIKIIKRTPVGLIQFRPKGTYGLISDDGMILDTLSSGKTSSFVIFEAYTTSLTKPRIGVRVKSPGYEEAVKFIRAYWNHSLAEREAIERVMLDQAGAVSVWLSGGPVLKLGRKPIQRLEAIEKVLPILEKQSRSAIEYIDLQYDDVIVKRKK